MTRRWGGNDGGGWGSLADGGTDFVQILRWNGAKCLFSGLKVVPAVGNIEVQESM